MEGDLLERPAVLGVAPPISIHALRVEGDLFAILRHIKSAEISIHALRVEGDQNIKIFFRKNKISIHALRVEGDWMILFC